MCLKARTRAPCSEVNCSAPASSCWNSCLLGLVWEPAVSEAAALFSWPGHRSKGGSSSIPERFGIKRSSCLEGGRATEPLVRARVQGKRLAVGRLLLQLKQLTLSRLDCPPGVLKTREPAAALGEPCCLLPGVLMPWMRVMVAVGAGRGWCGVERGGMEYVVIRKKSLWRSAGFTCLPSYTALSLSGVCSVILVTLMFVTSNQITATDLQYILL